MIVFYGLIALTTGLSFLYIHILRSITDPKLKMLYIIFPILLFIAYNKEADDSGCKGGACSSLPEKDIVCTEAKRVAWRRAYMVSFIVFYFFSVTQERQTYYNVYLFMAVWLLLYFYINYEQYHRFQIFCDKLT